MSEPKNGDMPPRTLRRCGALALALGLGASGVGCWFFLLGLAETERDAASRAALAAGGILLTAAQLAGFGIAAALPLSMRRERLQLRALGIALFCFEVSVIGVSQFTLVKSADVAAGAQAASVAELRQQLADLRATAAGLRELAAAQSRSKIAASRESGAQALRQAVDVDGQMRPLAAELAGLESAERPTLSAMLGEQRAAAFVVARSALIALTGLVMTSVASALFRAARAATPAGELRRADANREPVRAPHAGRAASAAAPIAAAAAAVVRAVRDRATARRDRAAVLDTPRGPGHGGLPHSHATPVAAPALTPRAGAPPYRRLHDRAPVKPRSQP